MTNVLVTGGSSGIGRAIVLRLARANYNVITCARNQEALGELNAELARERRTIFTYKVDLRREEEIQLLFREIADQSGPLDVLVNNAGLGFNAPLCSGDTDYWRAILEVNVLAVCICTREAIRTMNRHNRPGHIVNICSLSGHRLGPEGGLYAASKFALSAITETLRRELLDNNSRIKVSQISPGLVKTEFHQKFHQDLAVADNIYNQYPPLTPEDIAEAVYFAISQPTNVNVNDIVLRPMGQSL